MTPTKRWFMIKSVMDGSIISCHRSRSSDFLRSQVYVYPTPHHVDAEYWRWKGSFLENKKTGLVLDIRKGRLRLIEDTEICLYHAKPQEDAINQQWAVRTAMDEYNREQSGYFIYSLSNEEWVIDLDIHAVGSEDGAKLVLYPVKTFDNVNQQWEFIDADTDTAILDSTSQRGCIKYPDLADNDMSECRRCSQSSIGSHSSDMSMEALKECHHRAYLENDPHLSNRTIAMAAAHFALTQWKLDIANMNPSVIIEHSESIQRDLQACAAQQAANLFDKSDTLSSDKTTATKMAIAIVTQFYAHQLHTL
ncbi:hypothetical protein K450DRAFT_279038 [Umbelopsis ramanniana AG]|uniref:Ricin B lectin domain-containing protein n=1 Tax=Umbelopsis ramanniana AG TaxID=1314678 RepID=A0AAD5EDV9_UMBRA|nr:uncharacterized protein K450DRAFT_279038 [Umbelopsis ramanniana AG]KAI8581602.1 hypothetical protein K450DRAFT_279038 [Umbelopsis ramanniana AG]